MKMLSMSIRLLSMFKVTKGSIGSQSIIIRIQHCIEMHCVFCGSLVIVGCGKFSANCTLIPMLVMFKMWHHILQDLPSRGELLLPAFFRLVILNSLNDLFLNYLLAVSILCALYYARLILCRNLIIGHLVVAFSLTRGALRRGTGMDMLFLDTFVAAVLVLVHIYVLILFVAIVLGLLILMRNFLCSLMCWASLRLNSR